MRFGEFIALTYAAMVCIALLCVLFTEGVAIFLLAILGPFFLIWLLGKTHYHCLGGKNQEDYRMLRRAGKIHHPPA